MTTISTVGSADRVPLLPVFMSRDAARALEGSIALLRLLELKGQLHPVCVESCGRRVRLFLKEEVEQLAAARRKQAKRRRR